MKKLLPLITIILLFFTSTSAQKPNAVLQKAPVAPVIGGSIDSVWSEVQRVSIEREIINETPTVSYSGESYWKGLWTLDGIYILVYVADNDYYPFYQRSTELESDKSSYDQVEIYFDCNFEKADGIGGKEGGNNGHYKIAPATGGSAFAEGYDDGTLYNDYLPELGYQYSINASDDPHYFVEYFIPFSSLKDEEGVIVDIESEIGFDVVIVDNDSPGGNEDKKRMVWANNLVEGIDNGDNMDNAGLIYLDGINPICNQGIIITGGEITYDNEQFKIPVEACPENLLEGIKWIINEEESTAKVRVSDDGIVTPIRDGVLKIKAQSPDGYVESNEITIYISGQRCRPPEEMSWLIDGNNDMPNNDGSPNNAWEREDGLNNHTAFIEDGVFRFYSDSVLSTPTKMKVRQVVDIPLRYAEEEFTLGFTMWAETDISFQLVLEDRNNNWAHWGFATETHTPSAISNNGNTRWDLTVTTKPQRFKMNFIPSNINENSILDFCFQPGLTNVFIQMDSLYLFTVEESEFVDWDGSCLSGVSLIKAHETLKVYPNPVNDLLNIILEKGNTNVAIYNSMGIKIEEFEVAGNNHVFDVSKYSSGLYFIKANQIIAKFVKN